MNETMRKKLTEYLGECWHAVIYEVDRYVCSCGESDSHQESSDPMQSLRDFDDLHRNRIFTTRSDMMDLYEAIWKNKRYFPNFHDYVVDIWSELSPPTEQWDSFTAWLLCLDGDYERGCRIVGEWLSQRKEGT